MNLVLIIQYKLIFVISIFLLACSSDEETNKLPPTPIEDNNIINSNETDCVDFIALWPAADIADKLGKDKKWVFLNYTIDLWDIPPSQGVGNVVGKLRASSYARIISTQGEDYQVESPINQVYGWVNQEHVKTISKKNPKTRALCD